MLLLSTSHLDFGREVLVRRISTAVEIRKEKFKFVNIVQKPKDKTQINLFVMVKQNSI